MRLEHPDYIKLVVDAYNKKRINNELSPLLAKSTPANIRRECINVFKERFDKKDEMVLRAFFGPAESDKKFLQIIQEFETNRFKPLDNFLKGETEKTDDRNLELLAWLIDFRYRPFVFDKQVVLTKDELSVIGKSEKESGGLLPLLNSGKIQSKTKPTDNKSRITLLLIGLAILSGIYIFWQTERSTKSDNGISTEKQVARCQAITKKGTQCKRIALSNGYCWQHQPK